MLLNFQRQFADRVRAGLKRQTIRSAGQRKDVPCVGAIAHCYTGLRTRNTVKLGSWPIDRVSVLRMRITQVGIEDVLLGADPLSPAQRHQLAVDDGFTDWVALVKWFVETHGPQEFYGWVIGWAWAPASGTKGGA